MERAVKFALYLIEEIAVIINITAIGARISADVFNFVSGKSHGVSHFLHLSGKVFPADTAKSIGVSPLVSSDKR